MKARKWMPRAAAGALVLTALMGMALAAGQQGSQSDPLVTLSYLTQKLTPEILAQVDGKVTEEGKALAGAFDQSIQDYAKKMEDKLSKAGGAAVPDAAFTVVDVAAGQKLTAGIGCELMLRVGSAVCSAPSAPGLIDMTDGATLGNGGALVKNHLYMATVEGRGFTAQENVKVLVRGTYTIG